MSVRQVLAARRHALVDQWVERTLGTYPPATARFMAAEADPFRNPAGHTLRQNLAVLFDSAILADDWTAAERAVREIVRLRAVQDFSAEQALSFVAMLLPITQQATGGDRDTSARIDRLAELARVAYQDCRARIEAARAHELERREWKVTRGRRSGPNVRRPEEGRR